MRSIYLISKNTHLFEILGDEPFECIWFNDHIKEFEPKEIDDKIVIYDSVSYGPSLPDFLSGHLDGVIILGDYIKEVHLKKFMGKNRAYLLIHDFINELPAAVYSIIYGKNFISKKIKDRVLHGLEV